MVAAIGFAASVLFLLQVSYFAACDLLLFKFWGTNKVAANGFAASAHTPIKNGRLFVDMFLRYKNYVTNSTKDYLQRQEKSRPPSSKNTFNISGKSHRDKIN